MLKVHSDTLNAHIDPAQEGQEDMRINFCWDNCGKFLQISIDGDDDVVNLSVVEMVSLKEFLELAIERSK
jgi:hypothetical protein